MKSPLLELILLGFTILPPIKAEQDCLMYGSCDGLPDDVYCTIGGPAKPLEPLYGDYNNSGSVKILKEICPMFVKGENPKVCCGTDKLLIIKSALKLLGVLGLSRCPSCIYNFKQIVCNIACSPRQRDFINITRTTKLPSGNEKVEEVDFFVHKKFAYSLYYSCKGVRGLSSGTYLLDYGLCGSWGYQRCTPERFYEFMGAPREEGGVQSLKATTIFAMEQKLEINGRTILPAIFDIKKCSEPPDPESEACSCSDCEEVCSAEFLQPPELPPPPQPFTILGYDGYFLLKASTFIFIIVIFNIFICLRIRNKRIREENHTGQSSSTDEKPSVVEKLGTYLEDRVEKCFRDWGLFVCDRPVTLILASLSISFALCLGVLNFKMSINPVELWSSPTSRSRKDMNYFHEHFGPFYRIEQIIVTPTNQEHFNHEAIVHQEIVNISWGPVFRRDFLLAALDLQTKTEYLTAKMDNDTVVTLQDICMAPLRPFNDHCAVQSAFGFIKNKPELLDPEMNYLSHLLRCANLPNDLKCFAAYGGPLQSTEVLFGGFTGKNYETAEALLITIPVINFNDESKNAKARVWESKFTEFMENFSHPLLNIAFKAERSIEDEIEKVSRSDLPLVAMSYMVMFAYITITLGEFHRCKHLLLDSKLLLGFFGVSIVLLSVFTSLGIFCFAGVSATVVVLEVIPFLVLAVGVDNIFILVQAYQRTEKLPDESVKSRLGRVVGNVAPSILLSTVSMCSCFFIGALSDMPAVRRFALYAGVALVVNFLLQMTCFLAIFYLDSRRQEDLRLDVCCCIALKQSDPHKSESKGIIYAIFKNIHAPLITKSYIRYIVVSLFSGWLCYSIGVIPKIELGLDNKLLVPEDSYLMKYIVHVEKYLSVGLPVYFVVTEGYDYSKEDSRNKICYSRSSCDSHSLTNELARMSLMKNRTYIALSPESWLDNYLEYIQGDSCCYTFKSNGTHCPSNIPFNQTDVCVSCRAKKLSSLSTEEFVKRVNNFVSDTPWERCPKGGKAQFASSVEIIDDGGKKRIGATNFMTFHTLTKTSKDFYESLRWSRMISENLTKLISPEGSDVRVFPYSLMHVFFEQYLTIWEDTAFSLGLTIAAVFCATLLLMGLDFRSAIIVVVCVSSITVDLMGMMYWWDISLNAATLVNLVVGVGISVEFCSHITRSFAISRKPSHVIRAQDAITQMGSSVLAGITLTDCGILLLAFAKSQLFRVIYFKMYLGIIVIGTLHGLVLLPVLLSYFGPQVKKKNVTAESSTKSEQNGTTEKQMTRF